MEAAQGFCLACVHVGRAPLELFLVLSERDFLSFSWHGWDNGVSSMPCGTAGSNSQEYKASLFVWSVYLAVKGALQCQIQFN